MLKGKIVILFICMAVPFSSTFAQKALSLENCIEIALTNNQDYKNLSLQTKIAAIKTEQSQLEKYPSLSSDFSQGFNLGRNVDPFSNQFVTRPINSANLGFSSSTTLYNGGQIRNTTKLHQLEKDISQAESEKNKIEIKKSVALAYLEVVLKKEILRIKKEQKTIIDEQIKRSNSLSELGNEATANKIDLNAQLENEIYQIIDAEANLKFAKLKLSQILNQKDLQDFEVQEPLNITIASQTLSNNIVGIAHLKQKQLEINQANLNLILKQSQKKPVVFLNGGLFSNFSSEAPSRFKDLGGTPKQEISQVPNQFVKINNQTYPINEVIVIPNLKESNFGYFNQLFSNLGLGLKVNFQYPIYDKGLRNSRIQAQRIEKMMAQNNYIKAEQAISNELKEYKMYIDLAKDKYTQAQNQEKAQTKAFELAKMRFEEGMTRLAEFNQSKINLESAKSNVIQNKFAYYYYTLVYKYFFE
jgi:outer membrane protein